MTFGVSVRRVGFVLALTLAGWPQSSWSLDRAAERPQQDATATLSGTVVDETDAGVPAATVTLTHDTTSLSRTVSSTAAGAFVFAGLPSGTYTLRVQREGFSPVEMPNVIVSASEPTALRILLKVDAMGEMVVVTAQKRGEERVQDVPIPIAVLDADTLADHGQPLLRDYYASVPGLSLAPNYLSQQRLSIRGIQTGGSSPTVGIAIDDVPYGAATDQTGGASVPDIDPGDLARIEVLRGPQGTLYGANSMGGLVKYVMKEPSTAALTGRLEVGTSGVHNGRAPGYMLRASTNVPLSATWAVRASAFTRLDAGYIDNPVLHIDGLNQASAWGGRLSALWRPSDRVSLKFSALHQNSRADGASEVEVEPGLGDLQQNFLPNTRGYDWTIDAYSVLFKTRLRGLDVTSITGYNVNDVATTDDRSANYLASIQQMYGVSGVRYFNLVRTKKVTQEIRVSAPAGKAVEWWAGAFYTHEDLLNTISMFAEDTVTGRSVDRVYDYRLTRGYGEYAGFAGLTYHMTRRLDVQLGGRQSNNDLALDGYATTGSLVPIIFGVPSPLVQPRLESKTNAFTYLVTPSFKVSPDLMIYARFASGYRPGGPNSAVASAPPQFKADSTQNYEVGVKTELFARRLSLDASLYFIDWTDMQVTVRDATAIYFVNGGTAKSDGAEVSVGWRPLAGTTITGWLTYSDAALTKEFPAGSTVRGVPGDRLPFATRYSGYLSVDQEIPLQKNLIGVVGGAVSYVGDRVGVLQPTALRQELPAYTKIDLRLGVRRDVWTASLFVNNLTDARGLINGGLGYVPANVFTYIPPRTVGLSVSRSF